VAILSVDAGTTMVKAVVFDGDGRELALARQATVVRRPRPGFSEQDMLSVWDAVVSTVRQVARASPEPVDLLAFTAQGDGCWLVDEQSNPTGPAILWNDARAAGIVQAWDEAGALADAYRVNGTLAFPGTSSAILAWLREHDPERLARSHKALYCDGWLNLRLTGQFAVDTSDAASPFLDVRRARYSEDVLRILGLEWVEKLLPDLLPDDGRDGALIPAAGTVLGLRPGIPVVMAPFDIASTALGIGAVQPGQSCSILGTTLCTEVVVDGPDLDGTPSGMNIPLGVPGLYLRAFPTLAGAEVITWGMRLIGLDDPNWLSDLAGRTEPGAHGLFFQPYLSPAGERAPFRDAHARGALLGLSFEHTRAHIARAMLEGLTFVIRECLEASGGTPTELRVCGGGANSAFWCQLIADVTGLPTRRSADTEIGARGAALTGLVATGAEPDLATAARKHVHIRDLFEPDRAYAEQYGQLFADYRELRDQAAAGWPHIAAARDRASFVQEARGSVR
jgi:erythritol kinase (D-erythritol 1-phosphate-forming)